MPSESRPEDKLWEFCQAFVRNNGIHSPETIYQCDWVITNAYEFIEGVTEIVGYHPLEDIE